MLAVQEVVKGVHHVDTYANTFILTDNRLVLIDTSSEARPQAVLDALQGLAVQPKDLTSIIVTHTHPDHVSGLAEIRKRFPAKVAAYEIEAPFISKQKTYDGPPGPQTQRHPGTPVDVKLKDGQAYEGFRVVHTPGHTLGSMSLYDEGRRLLVAGDAVRNEAGLAPMEDAYNVDPTQHRRSIKKLAALDVDTLVCGHGDPIPHGAGAKLRALAASIP